MSTSIWVGGVVLAVVGFAGGAVLFPSSQESEWKARLAEAESALESQSKKLATLQREMEELNSFAYANVSYGSNAPETTLAQARPVDSTDSPLAAAASMQGARTPAEEPGSSPSAPPPLQIQNWVKKVIADEKAAEEARQKLAAEQRRIDRVHRRVERAVETLALSGLQKDQFHKVLLDEEQARAQIMERFRSPDAATEFVGFGGFGDSDGASFTDALREIRRTRDEGMKQVLTAEQLEKWNAQERRPPFFGGGRGGPAGPGGQGPR